MIKSRTNGHKYTTKEKSWRLAVWDKVGRLFESEGITGKKDGLFEFTTEAQGKAKAKTLGIELIIDQE